jgi:hypothetical protein
MDDRRCCQNVKLLSIADLHQRRMDDQLAVEGLSGLDTS